jgi:pimeloyl-ACP methyl ester carboxylesterase
MLSFVCFAAGCSDKKEPGDAATCLNKIEYAPSAVDVRPARLHYPSASTSQYASVTGAHVYLVQEPSSTISPEAPILIYMHGMGGKEEQGMEIFSALRSHLNKLGWIYVCPRDNEYSGLLSDLKARYGQRKVYLSGASAGGRWALWEAERHPNRYSGLILMCPAVRRSQLIVGMSDKPLPMPVWVVCGGDDVMYAAASRWLTSTLKKLDRPVYYREIPDGDHNDPCKLIELADALSFLHENSQPLTLKTGDVLKAAPDE